MTKATQERTRMWRKYHRLNKSERAGIFGLHLSKRYNRPKIHTNHVKAKETHLSQYLNRSCLNQSNILSGNGHVDLSITKSSNSSVDLERNIVGNGERGGKPTYKFFESTESDLAMIKWLKKIKPRFMIAPDGFVPNSRIRSKIILKPVHLANLRQISSKMSKCEEIDRILFSQLVEGDGDLSTSYWKLTAQVNALIREELPAFMRNVYQEEKYRIEGLLSSDGAGSEPPHQIPTPRLPVSLNFMRERALMMPNNQVKSSKYQTHIKSILNAPSDTRRSPQSSGKYMDQTQFEDLLGQMISHVGSRSRVYELVSGALKRDPFALNQISEMLRNRTERAPFLETICSPTYLFDFLASLLGSRAAVRISLSEILGGSINKLDELAAQIDSDAAIIEFSGAFQEAWREATMLIQSYTPLSMSSSSILDMLIDGEESTEHIADMINGVDSLSQDDRILMNEMAMPFQIAPEILEQITTSVIACDVKRLKELKVAKFSAHEEGTERSMSPLNQLLLSERALAMLKLKSLVASNSLVRDTLNEVIHSSQTSVFEPTAKDYITLVNKGDDFFLARSDTPRPADEQVIDHFSNLTKRLRHVMAWAFIKDPLRGDLHKENFEHVVRHALQVTETANKQVIEYIAGAAKSRNVPELVQQAVAGSPEASRELNSFLGPGKSDFFVRTIQETRGQVVDRILRHCVTNSEPEEVSGVLQRIHDESNCETAKALIQSWIRLSLNISRLAVRLSVAKTAEKTRSLLYSAEILEAQSDCTTKAKGVSVPETALARPSFIWPDRMSAVEEPSEVTVVKSTKKRLIVKANTLFETRQSQTEALPTFEYDNDMEDDHTPVHMREDGAQLIETDNLEQIGELESTFSSTDREYDEFIQHTEIVGTADGTTEHPVSTSRSKPVETDFTTAAKKLTDDLITQKTVRRQKASSPVRRSSIVSQGKRSSFMWSPQSPSPVVESLLRLRKEYAFIETRSKTMQLSRLELRSKIEGLRDEGLLLTTFAELPEYEESDVEMGIQATKEQVKFALAHIQNAIDKLTISVLIEQSKHQLPKTNTRFARKGGFFRAGSTLLNETISSIARRSKSADQLKALLAASGRLAQPSKRSSGLEEPSCDVHSSSSAESSSTSSGDRANQCSRIQRLSELQTYCQTSAAQLLMADQVTQETLLLDEQGMQLRKFNTFFVENVRKFLGEFTLAIKQWGPDLEDNCDNRVSELKEILIERMTEMTENFPEDVKEKLRAAVDILVEDMRERLRTITESVSTEEDWILDEQQQLSEELTNQLIKAVTSIFHYRVRPITSEWKGLESAQPIQAERLNELRKNSISHLKDLVEVIRNELLGDNMTPPPVTAAINDRLNQLLKETQMAIKGQCKEIMKQNKLLARKTRRGSERGRVSLISNKLQSEDQNGEDQQPSTMGQEPTIGRSERGKIGGEMTHTSVPPPTPATESALVCSSRLDEEQSTKHLTHPIAYALRKTEQTEQMFEALEPVKTLQSPARTKVVHGQQMRIAPITRPLTKPKPMTLRVRENPKSPLATSPEDTNRDDVRTTVPHQEISETVQLEQPRRKLSKYVATDVVFEPTVADESTFTIEEKTPTDSVPKAQSTVGSPTVIRTREPLLRTRQTDVVRNESETKNHFINQEMGIFVKGWERKRGTPVPTYNAGTLLDKSLISEVLPEGSSLVESVSSTRPSISREISYENSSVAFQLELPEAIPTKGQKLSFSPSVSEKLWERTSFHTDSISSSSGTSGISLTTRRLSERVGMDKKPTRQKQSCLPPIVSLPARSRVVTRPSYIPCHEWSKMIGPRIRQTVRYDIDLIKESQLKRAEELHMSSSSLRRRYDMLDLFHRATLVEKHRNRLPPIQQHG